MARKHSTIFSLRQLEMMNAVWKLKSATIREIRDEMGGDKAGAYTSIATMLRILEAKGLIRHETFDRKYYYSPAVSQEKERRKALEYILDGFFGGNINTLMKTVIQTYGLDELAVFPADLEEDED
jgi:BlaI family transcriptional regulator, penicillinase repressor